MLLWPVSQGGRGLNSTITKVFAEVHVFPWLHYCTIRDLRGDWTPEPNLSCLQQQSVSQQPAGGASTASAAGRKMDSRIYVGSLHYDLTEPEIRRVFESFGTITDVTMSHEPATGKSKGFCFIEYDNAASATQALTSMNGFELAGRPIKVGRPDGASIPAPSMIPAPAATDQDARAQAQALMQAALGKQPAAVATAAVAVVGVRIHIGNVPVEIDSSKLRSIFESFGKITEVQLPEDPSQMHNHRGYGFISYDTHQSAQDAVDQMNDFELLGRRLKVCNPSWRFTPEICSGHSVPCLFHCLLADKDLSHSAAISR